MLTARAPGARRCDLRTLLALADGVRPPHRCNNMELHTASRQWPTGLPLANVREEDSPRHMHKLNSSGNTNLRPAEVAVV